MLNKKQKRITKSVNVGDTWEEKIGNTIYIIRTRKMDFVLKNQKILFQKKLREYLNSFPNCTKETCTCITPNHLDQKNEKNTWTMLRLCNRYGTSTLKKQGKYEEYERNKN